MLHLRLAAKYLLHRITANNRHGLHSPFVYRLVDKVIYDFCAKNAYATLKSEYAEIRNDRTFTTPPFKVVQLLYRLAADFRPGCIFKAGPVNPVVDAALRLAQPQTEIQSFSHITEAAQPALFYIDAGKSSVWAAFEQAVAGVHPGSLVIIHHIYRARQGRAEWQAIKAHPQVTVTIDLFWLQLTYFRGGQQKEHFKVKY